MRKISPAALGASLGIVGCFLPWVSLNVGCRSRSWTGLETPHGKYFLGMFVFILLGTYFARTAQRKVALGAALFCALMGLVAGVGSFRVAQNLQEKSQLLARLIRPLQSSMGVGIYLVTIGAAVVFLWSLFEGFRTFQMGVNAPSPVYRPPPVSPRERLPATTESLPQLYGSPRSPPPSPSPGSQHKHPLWGGPSLCALPGLLCHCSLRRGALPGGPGEPHPIESFPGAPRDGSLPRLRREDREEHAVLPRLCRTPLKRGLFPLST